MNIKSVLFGERAAGVYLKSEIFFPTDTDPDPNKSGKIVPAVGAIIVDDTIGLHNQLYVVVSVNQLTYEPTLVPASYVINSEAQVDRVLSYGNDIFMIYFSSVTKTINGSNINLTRLIVDNKLSLFGKHAATFQLIKIDEDGNEIVISRKYIAGENNTIIPDGTHIPMLDTGVEGIRKCDGCYTDSEIAEGEEIRCNVYTAGGLLIAQINLVAKKAHLLNETIDTANPIIGMQIKGTQQTPEGDLYLFQGQNVKELGIYVDLKYRDGVSKTIAIDNKRGFCYGLERVTSGVVDSSFEILVKYYLSDSDATGEITEDSGNIVVDNKTRYITQKAIIKIISGAKALISKVSPIPIWNATKNESGESGEWTLNFLRYRDSRLQTPIATSDPNNPEHVYIASAFDGTLFDKEQVVTIRYKEVVNNLGSIEEKETSFVIELRDPSSLDAPEPNVDRLTKWLIKDSVGTELTYGDNKSPHLRPRIVYYTKANSSESYYAIPADVFRANTSQTAVEVFLENFYTNANPPKRANESKAPTPTHFRIKLADKDGTPITQDAVEIANFTKPLNIIIPERHSNNYFVGKTVVVEFLKEIDNSTSECLYGVPVDVIV